MPEFQRHKVGEQVVRILREERLRQGISMSRLAEKAGLSQAIISLMEGGHRKPTLETVLVISDVLEVPLSDVIKRAEKAAAKAA